LVLIVVQAARGEELRVSSKEPLFVTAPKGWQAGKDKPATQKFPFETFHIVPPDKRNATLLITIFANDKPEQTRPEFAKLILRGDCRPYVGSADELPNVKIKEMKLDGGQAFYAEFVDPDLVGKPVKAGSFKTATPLMLTLDARYLIKVTILCDKLDGDDHRDALKIVQSIRLKK
jgi:hypothetical protein